MRELLCLGTKPSNQAHSETGIDKKVIFFKNLSLTMDINIFR